MQISPPSNELVEAPRRPAFRFTALLLVLLVTATACSGPDSTSEGGPSDAEDSTEPEGVSDDAGDGTAPSDGEPYRVGFLGPLSGALAPVGTSILAGMTAVIEDQNEGGGVHGRRIEIIPEDDVNESADAISGARALMAQEVVAITGVAISSLVEAVLPIMAREDTSLVSQGAPPSVLNPALENAWMVDLPSSAYAQPMIEFATELLGTEEFAATIGPVDTPSGVVWGEDVEQLAGEIGASVLASVPLPPTAADMAPQALQLTDGDPEIILIQATDGILVPLIQGIRDQGYSGPIVNFGFGSATATITEIADPDLYVARTTAQYLEDSDDPGTQRFVTLADAAGNVEVAQSATQYSQGHLIGLVVIEALTICGPECTPPTFTESMASVEVDTEGFTPVPLAFSAENHQGNEAVSFYQWQDGSIVPVLGGQAFAGSVYSLAAEVGG